MTTGPVRLACFPDVLTLVLWAVLFFLRGSKWVLLCGSVPRGFGGSAVSLLVAPSLLGLLLCLSLRRCHLIRWCVFA